MRSLKKQSLLLFAGLIGFLFYGSQILAGPSATMLANNCDGCHGPNGVTNGPSIPSIAGMTEEYLVLSMKDYKKGTRASTVMQRIAKGYSDDEIKAMAKHFSEQTYASVSQSTDKELAAEGNQLQRRYCNSCHEKNGKLADGIGIMAGQPVPYLNDTIADFMDGTRPMEDRKKEKMDLLVKDAGEKGFHAIVQYYGSQQ